MKRIVRDERGMALALAIVALVIVGALVAGAFFSATQEQRAGSNTRGGLQALGAAEEGGYEVIDNWTGNIQNYNTRHVYPMSGSALDSLAIPQTYPSSWTGAAHATGVYGGYLYKLNGELYLVDMTGRDSTGATNAALVQSGGGGRMRLGLIARIRPLQMQTPAALTTGNGDAVGGNSVINGADQNPAGWPSCGPLDSTRAGIRAASGNPVTISGNATVIGSPPVLIDTSVHNNTFSNFGGTTYTQLAAQATITVPTQNFATSIAPVVTNGQCDHSVLTNWGDGLNPTQPCGTYFPIVHITGTGTTIINGTQGQGILLVDGSLAIQGGFQWFGIAIIQGTLKTAGGGGSVAHFFGATLVHDSVAVGSNTVTGSANILYSSCAIVRALEMTQPAALMRSRSWVALF